MTQYFLPGSARSMSLVKVDPAKELASLVREIDTLYEKWKPEYGKPTLKLVTNPDSGAARLDAKYLFYVGLFSQVGSGEPINFVEVKD